MSFAQVNGSCLLDLHSALSIHTNPLQNSMMPRFNERVTYESADGHNAVVGTLSSNPLTSQHGEDMGGKRDLHHVIESAPQSYC